MIRLRFAALGRDLIPVAAVGEDGHVAGRFAQAMQGRVATPCTDSGSSL
jgi:hypothetical protein